MFRMYRLVLSLGVKTHGFKVWDFGLGLRNLHQHHDGRRQIRESPPLYLKTQHRLPNNVDEASEIFQYWSCLKQ